MTNTTPILYNHTGGIPPALYLDNSIPQKELSLTITVEELAHELNISRTTAYNLAGRKDFYPAFRVGNRLLISRQALIRWLDEQTEVSS